MKLEHKRVVLITGRYWDMVERLKINQFYGAPTAIRLLLKYGDQWVNKYDRSTLRTLGSGTTNKTKPKQKHDTLKLKVSLFAVVFCHVAHIPLVTSSSAV